MTNIKELKDEELKQVTGGEYGGEIIYGLDGNPLSYIGNYDPNILEFYDYTTHKYYLKHIKTNKLMVVTDFGLLAEVLDEISKPQRVLTD